MTEQERYLMRMSESLKDIGKTLGRINDCLERIDKNLRDCAPKEAKDDTATDNEGVSEV